MAATVIKVTTTADEGVPLDTVEKLLGKAAAGEELAVFTDTGAIIFVNDAHAFEEV